MFRLLNSLKRKIYICVKDTGVGFDVNEFEKKGIFTKYEKNEKYNIDGSGLGMEIVQDILKKSNSELNFLSDPKLGGSIFYFELVDTYPHNDFIVLKKIMADSIKKIFDDITTGKTDLFSGENKKKFILLIIIIIIKITEKEKVLVEVTQIKNQKSSRKKESV